MWLVENAYGVQVRMDSSQQEESQDIEVDEVPAQVETPADIGG